MYGREDRGYNEYRGNEGREEFNHHCHKHEHGQKFEGEGNMNGMKGRRGFGLKYLILELTSKEALTGAEIMARINEVTHGRWLPSPGVIYPTLKSMYDEKYLSMEERNNKKYYTVTETGRELLNGSAFPWNRMKSASQSTSAIIDEMENYTSYLNDNFEKLSDDEKAKIKEIVKSLNKFD
ncbi:MAG: PadR family transcriptional regulator [Ferroplasma sp.]